MARLFSSIALFLVLAAAANAEPPAQPAILDAPSSVIVDGCGDCCRPVCGPAGRTWFRADYLLWWIKETDLPPLITASPPGTPLDDAGVIGTPGATILAGNDNAGGDPRSGGRFTIGHWFDCEQTIGVEVGFFLLESQSDPFGAGSNGSAIISRPFINAITGQNDAELVSFPGILAGSAFGSANSSGLLGAEANLRKNLCCGCCYRLDALAGYRFLRYDEGLDINEILFPDAPAVAGTRIDLFDRFHTENEFHGLNLGLTGEARRGKWIVEATGKIALGCLDRRVSIDGGTLVTVPGVAPVFSQGGLLAQSTNIGEFSDSQFSVLPELDIAVGYQLTDNVRVRLGYSLLWLTDTARAADQVDLVVNPNLIPGPDQNNNGPQRPAFTLHESDIWVQGLAAGLEVRY